MIVTVSDTEFEGARVVITGGASGIGAALAGALVARKGEVAVVDIDGARAASLARSLGPSAAAHTCDVTDRHAVDELARSIGATLGGADLVFVNAGAAVQGALIDMDPREFDWLMDLNIRGAFNTIRAFAPLLIDGARAGRRTRFILTGSENSVGLPRLGIVTAYTATKHAILGMADGLRRDLAASGVGVSVLCPGAVNSRLWDARSARLDRFGGPVPTDAQTAEEMTKGFAAFGQDPDLTARLCLLGILNDEFIIFTHPEIREIAVQRGEEVLIALNRLDERLRG